jgi:hypothetical protein
MWSQVALVDELEELFPHEAVFVVRRAPCS